MNGLPQEKLHETPRRPMLLSIETARLLQPPRPQMATRRVRREGGPRSAHPREDLRAIEARGYFTFFVASFGL